MEFMKSFEVMAFPATGTMCPRANSQIRIIPAEFDAPVMANRLCSGLKVPAAIQARWRRRNLQTSAISGKGKRVLSWGIGNSNHGEEANGFE